MGDKMGWFVLGGGPLGFEKLNMFVIGFASVSNEPPPILPKFQLSSMKRSTDV